VPVGTGQYPQPYHRPRPNHEAAVSAMVASCHGRVRRQIQPRQLNAIQDVCRMKKPRLSAWSISTAFAARPAPRYRIPSSTSTQSRPGPDVGGV
jgi:hypothetical protein